MHTPTKEEVRTAREAAGLTQAQSAELVGITLNGWQKAEYGENNMDAARFELFLLKTKTLKEK